MTRTKHALVAFGTGFALTLSCALWLPVPPDGAAFQALTFLIAYTLVLSGPISVAILVVNPQSALGLIPLIVGVGGLLAHIATNKFKRNPWLQQALYFAWYICGIFGVVQFVSYSI